jgi:hypothetical protein
MEKKYQEQLRALQDEIQNERELANLQMVRLRSDCEQQVRSMQQVHSKCKDYCHQLELVSLVTLSDRCHQRHSLHFQRSILSSPSTSAASNRINPLSKD